MLLSAMLRDSCLDAMAVVFPTECSGCGTPDRALCASCRRALCPAVHAASRASRNDPVDTITVWSALEYAGVAQRVIGAYKDGGRTDAASFLADPLRSAVVAALLHARSDSAAGGADGLHLVTIPSSRRALRSRGFSPVELLMRKAGFRSTRVLRQTGYAVDQVGLTRMAREANKRGSLAATGPLGGARFVIVDDIVTTGATLFEARRAVTQGGGEVVGYATLAETRKRFEPRQDPNETRQQKL